MFIKRASSLIICIILFIFACIPVKAAAAGSKIEGYIKTTRKADIERKEDWPGELQIQWVQVIKKPEGIPVKDAFNGDGKRIAFLTFDDGPSKNVTPAILDILKRYDIKATFFVVGSMAKGNGEIVKRIVSEGHSIGNHSYSHEYGYLYRNVKNFMGEINATRSVLKGILGEGFETRLFRFPGGSFGNNHASLKAALKENGYEYINWNVSNGDSAGHNIPARSLIANVKESIHGKDHIVVLMHDLGSKHTTVEALPSIIEHLISQGYEFKKLINE